MLSADNLCKQFGPRSDETQHNVGSDALIWIQNVRHCCRGIKGSENTKNIVEKLDGTLILPDIFEVQCQQLALNFPDVSSGRSNSANIVLLAG